jgi:VIT1/CCC1 family predicted Fe2+/Mn2+ transporter
MSGKGTITIQDDLLADHEPVSNARLNSLRAAVLGANDGIVSVSSIILGVAGATDSRTAIFAAAMAGLVAGAMSMAVGEYVSVSSQRDTEEGYIAHEKRRLELHPAEEFEELAEAYVSRGLTAKTAHLVAKELTAHDAVHAHLETELNINEEDLSSPVSAALSSLIAFTAGGAIPLVTVMAVNHSLRLAATVAAVLAALVITGYLSATVGKAPQPRAILRNVIGGAAAMLITYGVGHLFGQIIG